MIRNSYISTTMMMRADIYEQENTQNPDTGAIDRHWEYKRTVKCQIQPTKTDGSSTKSDGKFYGSDNSSYKETSQLRCKFLIALSKRWRVSNIRSSDNVALFVEQDTMSKRPTIYEVVSCHAMTDPFGRLSHYDVTLERVKLQANDTI